MLLSLHSLAPVSFFPSKMASSGLTDEQKRRMEQNRIKALALKNAKKQQQPSPFSNPSGLSLSGQPPSFSSASSSSAPSSFKDTEKSKRVAEMNRLRALELRDSKRLKAEGQGTPFSVPSGLPASGTTSSAPSSMSNSSRYFSPPTATSTTRPGGASNTFLNKPYQTNKQRQTFNKTTTQSAHSSSTTQPQSNLAPIFRPTNTKVKISLQSPSRLSVTFAFKEDMIQAIKTLKTSSYDPNERKWTIDISDYANCVSLLKTIGNTELDTNSVPARLVSLIQTNSKFNEIKVNLLDKFDQEFIDKLYPFQREGIKFGIQRNGRCLIADDMGLGKTVQALGIVGWYKHDWPVLVVCPASVIGNWKNSILKWLGHLVEEYEIEELDIKDLSYHAKFFVGSYERMVKHSEEIIRRQMPTIIFDECHNIKSDAAQRTKAAIKIAKVSKHIILLSGTPALSRPMELYTQILMLNNKLFTNKHDFGLRYCDAKIMGTFNGHPRWDYRGHSNTDELKILLESTIMIRRLKKDVLQDLPSKNRIVIDLQLKLTEEERIELDKCKAKCERRNFYKQDNGDLMSWYRETCRLKIPAVLEYLERKISRTGKLICFAHHKVMIDAIADFLNRQKVKYIVITGETISRSRQELCDDFQNNSRTKVALISILAAGVGITLTAANLVIFTELSWNPGVLAQAEDRAHRIGQEENVTIEYLVSKGTCDDPLWQIIDRKLSVLGKVGLSKDTLKDTSVRDSNQAVIEDYFSKVVEEEEKKAKSVFEDETRDERDERYKRSTTSVTASATTTKNSSATNASSTSTTAAFAGKRTNTTTTVTAASTSTATATKATIKGVEHDVVCLDDDEEKNEWFDDENDSWLAGVDVVTLD